MAKSKSQRMKEYRTRKKEKRCHFHLSVLILFCKISLGHETLSASPLYTDFYWNDENKTVTVKLSSFVVLSSLSSLWGEADSVSCPKEILQNNINTER
jgi:hypothetical protein